MTALARITIYPIKSLDGIDVNESQVLPSGALCNDRRWAIVDAEGKFVNGKRTAMVHKTRATFSNDFELVTLSTPTKKAATFRLVPMDPEISLWLSDVFQTSCKLVENRETGFPDDLDAPGPTLLSQGTIREIGNWFSLSVEEVHRRFRANLVVAAEEPFWEDRLVGAVGQPVPFSVGGVNWFGVNVCQRCVVPSRSPIRGETIPGFQRDFTQQRQKSLPTWSRRDRFEHFYRLAVNTRLAESNSEWSIRVGNEVRHLDSGPSLF